MASRSKKQTIPASDKAAPSARAEPVTARNSIRSSPAKAPEPKSERRGKPTQRKAKPAAPENFLRPSTPREIEQSAMDAALAAARTPRKLREPSLAPLTPAATEASAQQPATAAAAKPDPTAVPDGVRQRFVQVGAKFYFPDGTRAFTDRGRRLTTASENTVVIQSLVQIAQARGWSDITVSGSERFRREAWFAASSENLIVRGYKPTLFERESLAKSMERRGATRGASPERPARNDSKTDENRLLVGRLIDYGRATYKHDPHESMSYYLKLETGRGERTVWGVDLERAFREAASRPQLGDEIGVRRRGHEPVVVKANERDAEGRVIGQKPLDTHRNQWIVEKSEFFAAAASAKPSAESHAARPLSAEVQLKAAEAFAKQKIRDPEDRKRFVEQVAQKLEKSKASEATPLRRTPTTPERAKPLPSRKIERVRE